MRRYLRYAVLGARILLPSREERRQARLIRESGLFDRTWYLACNPRLPRICRWLPERHYVLVGEALGLCPSPGFSPRAYRHRTPGLPEGVGEFAHYITSGEAREMREHPAGQNAPALPVIAPAPPEAPFAVILHLYYRENWPDLARRLARQRFAFDLFVTLTKDPAVPDAAIRARIRADFPQARITSFPNHGRDILPFLHLARSGALSGYRAICKIHTKRSPHRADGETWRDRLLDGVLGDPARVARRLEAFLTWPDAGIWVANGQILEGPDWWGPNRARAGEILNRAGIAPGDLRFAAGSIYWIRPELLLHLAALPVGPEDFEEEMGQVDGTTAHALERAFGLVARQAGLALIEARDLDRPPAAPRMAQDGTGRDGR
ncbi:MAG: rhamnan synthesis F family protein [Pseudorhodobacter sp.]